MEAGLAEVDAILEAGGMPDHLPLAAARAELPARAGRLDESPSQAALSSPGNDATKRELSRRRDELLVHGHGVSAAR